MEKVDNTINTMLKIGVIERSDSTYINPLVVAAKKDFDIRLCLDARELNERLESDHDGPEEMEQVFKRFKGAKFMSSVDLMTSFWQVTLNVESRKFTAFIHRCLTYHYVVVPFGTKVSMAALARAAEKVFKGLAFVLNFVDDWVLFSDSFEDHLWHLEILFSRCYDEGITLKFGKLIFCRKEITFLGNILTTVGIIIDPEKVKAIHEFPLPRNAKQLKSFLGLSNFCSKYTHELAEAVGPLLALLHKGVRWNWGQEHFRAFDKAREIFCMEIMLYHPNKNKPFILTTDASQTSLGAYLAQVDNEGHTRLVYCASRTLKGAELRYFATELELLAIVWSLQKFRSFLLGSDVIIRTDHKALTFLNSCKFLTGRLTR